MPRRATQHHEPPGNDSFLDIVANIVGILIILVMVVGVRVKHAPPLSISELPTAEEPAPVVDLSAERERVENARRNLAAFEQVAAQQINENRELAVQVHSRRVQRERLSTSVTAIDYKLKEKQK
ncbi:MAG: hypothetical protein MI757_07100, partial [Pirellulales bacterium]|nr:hypothetical protein [Pirellulales bacterium]